ncbi:MAG TPA: M48 family metalloprotease [Candidatus Aquilonibacter sp.]|nr:M48 family metalloprotease [Candidatus Aquilonibacter sp.]
MRNFRTIIVLLLVSVTTCAAAQTSPVSFDQTVDRVVARERKFVATMKGMQPLAETYIQNLGQGKDREVEPVSDQYFLGRVFLNNDLREPLFKQEHAGFLHQLSTPFSSVFSEKFLPQGFAQMAILDADFQKNNYRFSFVRREFLGEVRCIVIDVQPTDTARKGLFTGRIWVEDRDFNIVRFNGTYSGSSKYKHYLHFDSWRFNLQADVWLPSYIYVEESGEQTGTSVSHDPYFKAQTRLWGYAPEQLKHNGELTQIEVDNAVDDGFVGKDNNPLKAQRMWQRMAEDNAVDHLQKIGLVAPAGDVDKVLQTVVNNLIIANKLEIEPEVRCRVLLTLPLESFTIGHTIVVSRGLVDALPDESSLAAILAHELGHIVLGHGVDTRFAFSDRFFFADRDTFRRLDFERSAGDEKAADSKAIELLTNSTYKDKLSTAGLFLRALHDRSPVLTNLIRPHLGNRMANGKSTRMAELLNSAPALEKQSLDQIAALPIGSRIKLDPWSNQITMMNTNPVAPLSAGEKMPFEVSPFFPFLRYSQTDRKLIAENPGKP